MGDTHRNMDFWVYAPFASTEGFESAYRECFGNEMFMVLYHPKEYTILVLDSCLGQINRADLYFNWRANKGKSSMTTPGMSGHMTCPLMIERGTCIISDEEWREAKKKKEAVFVGHQTVVDGLGRVLEMLRKTGTFVEWIEAPTMSFVHHGDDYKRDHDDDLSGYVEVSGFKSME